MRHLTESLRDDQRAILANPAQIKVVACGRRWGKTFGAGLYICDASAQGASCAWVAPTYKNSRPLWSFVEAVTNPQAVRVHKAEREIDFPGGGRIGIYSADNDVSIRGEAFDLVVIDEAAQVKEETYTDVVLPTIADRNGRIILISTPKGKNWFYNEYLRALDVGAAWQAPSNANPNPNIRRAFELARERVSERTFNQEWLAQFVEGGVLFRNVRELATLEPQQPQTGHDYIIGVDWARSVDYTVFAVVDRNERALVYLDRFTGIDYPAQLSRLEAAHRRWNYASIIAETNAMGKPMTEFASGRNLPIQEFNTTAESKRDIIDALIRAFEFREIRVLRDTTLINELESFEELARSVNGMPRYGAPAGLHDDTVMALALAWCGISGGVGILFEA